MSESGDDGKAGRHDWRPAFDLILEEARRSIDAQMASVYESRQRAGTLLAAAGIVGAALGFTNKSGVGDVAASFALCGFGFVALSTFVVLLPYEFNVDLRASRMLAWFDQPGVDVDAMLQNAAEAHDENHANNANKVAWLQIGLTLSVIGLAAETLALLASAVF